MAQHLGVPDDYTSIGQLVQLSSDDLLDLFALQNEGDALRSSVSAWVTQLLEKSAKDICDLTAVKSFIAEGAPTRDQDAAVMAVAEAIVPVLVHHVPAGAPTLAVIAVRRGLRNLCACH